MTKTFDDVKYQDRKIIFEWVKTGVISYSLFERWLEQELKEERQYGYDAGIDQVSYHSGD